MSLQPVNPLPSLDTSNSPTSYSDIVQSNLPVKQPRHITLADQTSRKFNVVVYGIKEKPKGSLKHTRLIQDTDDVSEVFKKLDSSISAQSIRDCTRLGKYTDNKCRPVLVKLSRSFEVSSLLSQCKKLKDTPGVSIKPDMSPDKRKVDFVLMSKRWDIIQSGTAREYIKIRGNSIYVNNFKKGFVDLVDFSYKDIDISAQETTSNLLTEDPSVTDKSQSD